MSPFLLDDGHPSEWPLNRWIPFIPLGFRDSEFLPKLLRNQQLQYVQTDIIFLEFIPLFPLILRGMHFFSHHYRDPSSDFTWFSSTWVSSRILKSLTSLLKNWLIYNHLIGGFILFSTIFQHVQPDIVSLGSSLITCKGGLFIVKDIMFVIVPKTRIFFFLF